MISNDTTRRCLLMATMIASALPFVPALAAAAAAPAIPPLKTVRTDLLEVAYAEYGPAAGPATPYQKELRPRSTVQPQEVPTRDAQRKHNAGPIELSTALANHRAEGYVGIAMPTFSPTSAGTKRSGRATVA